MDTPALCVITSRFKVPGVYAIIHRATFRAYIGGAANIYGRRTQHASRLRHGFHSNPHLLSAWNLYGESAFDFVVLETVDASNAVLQREQWWLDNAVAGGFFAALFNIRTVAESNASVLWTPERRAKMLAAMRGRASPRAVAASVLARRGKPLSETHRDKIAAASRSRMADPEVKKKSLAALHAGLRESWADPEKRARRVAVMNSPEVIEKIRLASAKEYHGLMSPGGEVFDVIHDITAFCRSRGLDPSTIIKVLRGKRKQYKGWRKAG